MKEIGVTEFKATCLSVIEKVRKTRKPIRITRFGKPIAELVPSSAPPPRPKSWLGCMAGTGEIIGDIVGPSTELSEWSVYREE